MARALRIDFPGAWHHVTSRGNERRNVFRTEADRRHWTELLAQLPVRFEAAVHAYVLMLNHYHVIIECGAIPLQRVMQWLNVSYTVWFNRRHRRVGHLFQGRYKSVLVEPEEWGLTLSRYVHLNPVRIARLGLGKKDQAARRFGLAPAASAQEVAERLRILRDFRWSSYRAYCGHEAAPAWLSIERLQSMAPGSPRRTAQNYRASVEEAVRDGIEQSPWQQLQGALVLGGTKLKNQIKTSLRKATREHGRARHLLRWQFDDVIKAVEKVKKERWQDFCHRHGDWGRDAALWLGRTRCGLTLPQLAERAGGITYQAAGLAIRRWEIRMRSSRTLTKAAKQIIEMLHVEI